jgi:hypothetical protein
MGDPGEPATTTTPSVERRVEADRVRLSDAKGQAYVECPARNVVLVRTRGYQTEAMARAVTVELERVIARVGPVHNFFDAQHQAGLEPGVRSYWQAWLKTREGSVPSTQILLPASFKLVAMALSVANMMLGGRWRVHAQPASFEAALRAATHG